MTFTAILLIILALGFFILTRTAYIYIKYKREFCLEFHFVIFSFALKTDERDRSSESLKLAFYSSLLKRLSRLIKRSEVRVMRLSLKNQSSDKAELTFPFPYGLGALISMLIAYFENNSKKLTIEDNAIILTPDTSDTEIELRLYTELFNIITALVLLTFDLYKNRKKRKLSYVGN